MTPEKSQISPEKSLHKALIDSSFHVITETPRMLIIGLDKRGRITLFNKGCEKLTGYTQKEAIGRSLFTLLIPKNQRQLVQQGFQKLKNSLTPSHGINNWITKQGEERTIEWNNTVTVDTQGKVRGIFGIGVDITDHKKAQEALLLQNSAISSSPSGMVITDIRGRILFANPAFLNLIGYKDPKDVLDQNALELVGHEDLGPQILKQLLEKGTYSGEYRQRLENGRLLDIHILASVITDNAGMPTHFMATISDISKLKEAEAEYQSLFESVPVGLFRTKPGVGEILDVNPALVNMLGYHDKASLIRMNASSFYVNPAARQKWEALVAQEGIVRGFEAQFRRLDGQIIWVRLSSRAIRNHHGDVIYYEGTLEDITERKHAQEALMESEERYRLFFENITDVILYLGPDLKILDVSPSIENYLGYHPAELKGKYYPKLNLIAPEYLPLALENSKRLFLGETVPPYECPFLAKDGSRIWGEVSSAHVMRDGKVVALFSLVRNIHARKLAEIELKNTNQDLELYASLLRHDLGNDLQVLFSTTEVAQLMAPPKTELLEFIEATHAAAERMVRLLDVFGRPDKEAENQIVTLLERVASQAIKTHTHLTVKVKSPQKVKDLRVTGGRLLPMVFDNLFRNAAQHAGPNPIVDVIIKQERNQVKIDISDDGPGIPERIRKNLFERGISTTESGLGLHLSKRILKAYGGSIELLASPLGKGASFRILLPLEES